MQKNGMVQLTEKISQIVVVGFAFLFPLFFLPITSEFNEYNKIILLIITTVVLTLLWVVRIIIEKQIVVVKTPLDLALLLLVIVFILSSITSVSRFTSIFGEFNSWHWLTIELVAWVVFLMMTITQLKGKIVYNQIVKAFTASAFLSAILAILIYFKVFNNLTFTGVFQYFEVIKVNGFLPAGGGISAIVLFFVGLLFAGYFVYENIKLLKQSRNANTLVKALTPGLVTVTILAGLIVTVISFLPIREDRLTFNQLDFSSSWKIATLTMRDYPLFGTGPGTYSVAYNAYRPIAINQTNNWTTIFDRAGSEYLTLLTTLGLVGLFAFVFFIVRIFVTGKNMLASTPGVSLRYPIFIALGSLLFAYIFVSSTVFTTGVLFLLILIWLLYEKSTNDQFVEEVSLNLTSLKNRITAVDGSTNVNASSSIIALIVAAVVIIVNGLVLWYTVSDFASNVSYAKAIRAINENKPAQEIYTAQGQAINLNPYRDEYRRAYADTNIRLANIIAQQKGTDITDTDKTDITTLIEQAIREVRVTTELINPNSAYNWQVRGNVYQNLLGVASGADQWAYAAYQNAIRLAPFDPRLRVNMGSLFFTLALNTKAEGTEGEAPTSEVPNVPQSKEANLAQAEAAFLDAIQLKSDYANAHYNLAAVYKEAKRYDLAKTQLQATLQIIDPQSAEYQQVTTELEAVKKLALETK